MGMSSTRGPEINVTPLIDVLLVLLIIFLVMIPIMMKQEQVLLPPKDEQVISELRPVVLKMHADLTVTVDDGERVQGAELLGAIRTKTLASKAVFVDFDPGVPWQEVVSMVDTVRSLSSAPNHDDVSVAVRIADDAASSGTGH
jgi:biopolymer transport protein ExbD